MNTPTTSLANAIALQRQGKLPEAAAVLDDVLLRDPRNFDALHVAGILALQSGDLERGLGFLTNAVTINPNAAKVHRAIAAACVTSGQNARALAAFERMIALDPEDVKLQFHRASALQELGRLQEAVDGYTRYLAAQPDDATVQTDLSRCLLLMGQYEEGFRHFEWRKRMNPPAGVMITDKPLWLGESSIKGKTLLLFAEQGLGDTIQFSRYALNALAEGANVVLAVQPVLQDLIKTLSPGIDVRSTSSYIPDFDVYSPLMSLPLAFKTSADTVPAPIPYLSADPRRVDMWKQTLGGDGFKIGLSWQGSRGKIDHGRSFTLAQFRGLGAVPSVQLVSLQKNDGADQLASLPAGMTVQDLGPAFDTGSQAFLDTAAVMTHLDLVITSDTAAAHLAGALGRPVWVALKYSPDWRWHMQGSTTPWYPTMRLFRQTSPGDWDGVFQEMEAALKGSMDAA